MYITVHLFSVNIILAFHVLNLYTKSCEPAVFVYHII